MYSASFKTVLCSDSPLWSWIFTVLFKFKQICQWAKSIDSNREHKAEIDRMHYSFVVRGMGVNEDHNITIFTENSGTTFLPKKLPHKPTMNSDNINFINCFALEFLQVMWSIPEPSLTAKSLINAIKHPRVHFNKLIYFTLLPKILQFWYKSGQIHVIWLCCPSWPLP